MADQNILKDIPTKQILSEGSAVVTRKKLNFIGAEVADNPITASTDVDVSHDRRSDHIQTVGADSEYAVSYDLSEVDNVTILAEARLLGETADGYTACYTRKACFRKTNGILTRLAQGSLETVFQSDELEGADCNVENIDNDAVRLQAAGVVGTVIEWTGYLQLFFTET